MPRPTSPSRPSSRSPRDLARALSDETLAVEDGLATPDSSYEQREAVEEYMEAMRTGDVNRVVAMLAEEDAAWSMPPLASWYGGLEELRVFLERGPLSGEWQWRHAPARANGQLAVGTCTWAESAAAHLPFSLDVLTLGGERIKEVTAFVVRTVDTPDGYSRWPEYATDPVGVRSVFERFGLPSRVS